MRLTGLADNPKRYVANGASIVAPTGGWDTLSPLASMKPDRAIQLDNFFPHFGYVELRNGHVEHSDTASGVAVESLMPYQGSASTKLFAASGGSIFDVTTDTPSEDVMGLTNARWQYTMVATSGGHFLWCCNGEDDPQYFDGTSWATAAVTGTGITGPTWINVVPYKSRLWGVIKDTTKAAYLPLDSIQGAATAFDVGGEFMLGGYLQSIGVWSTDSNDGPTSYLVFVSSRGEILVYSITDPTSPTGVSLLGKGIVGVPTGRRCMTQIGSDLALICQDGILPISQCLSYDRAALIKIALTANIQPTISHALEASGDAFGWQLTSYPRASWAVLNVPVTEGVSQKQFVMNSITGAWCQFLGMDANCWAVYNDDLYFGGNDGIVYKADTSSTDNGEPIYAEMKTAFNYFGSRGQQKRWTLCRPVITTDDTVAPGLAIDVDFRDTAAPSAQTYAVETRARWGRAIWGQSVWPQLVQIRAQWQSVIGLGYCAAVKMSVSVAGEEDAAEVTLQINSFDLIFEKAVGQYV